MSEKSTPLPTRRKKATFAVVSHRPDGSMIPFDGFYPTLAEAKAVVMSEAKKAPGAEFGIVRLFGSYCAKVTEVTKVVVVNS